MRRYGRISLSRFIIWIRSYDGRGYHPSFVLLCLLRILRLRRRRRCNGLKELHLVYPVFGGERQTMSVRPPMKQADVHVIIRGGVGFPRLKIEPLRLSQESISCEIRCSEAHTEEASGGGGMIPCSVIE